MQNDPESWTPPWSNLPREGLALYEYLRMRLNKSMAADAPRGAGEPILVFPGFGQSDKGTAPLRQFLNDHGFSAYGWDEDRNLGLKPGATGRLLARIAKLAAQHGQAVTLVGWSLGGVIARELARKSPDLVQRVISLGSPLAGPQTTTLQPIFELLNPKSRGKAKHDPQRYAPPPVPCTAIYSRRDGIVAWQASRELPSPTTESIEVTGAHLALGYNPAVWYVICFRSSAQTRELAFRWHQD